MVLVLEATLSAPPSSVHCFRDVSLYATVFKNLEVITACDTGTRDIYWKWLKKHGAMDFIQDIVKKKEVIGVGYTIIGDSSFASFKIPKLNECYLNKTISKINGLQTL